MDAHPRWCVPVECRANEPPGLYRIRRVHRGRAARVGRSQTGTVEVRLVQQNGRAPQIALTVARRGIGQTIHLSLPESEQLAAQIAAEVATVAKTVD